MALGLTPHQIIEKGIHPQLVIADEWERVELKKIASVQNGYAFSSKLFNRTEGMPLIRIRDIFSVETENLYLGEYKEDFVVNKGDILIGMDGDFKVSKWPGNKGLLNQRVCRIHFDSNHYDKEFLFICIQPYLNAIHSETSAVTVKHLSSRTINDIPFPLPPLPEQRAIVAKIEELFSDLDKGIADLKKAQDQLKVYRQSVLSSSFPKKELMEISKLVPSLSQGWSPKCINQNSSDETQWAVIKTSAIQAGRFVDFENKILPESLEPREQHEIKTGDILITRAGPRVRVGICCLVRNTRPRLINCDKVYRLILDRDQVDGEYFEYVMNSPEILSEIEVMKSGTSDSGLNLTQKAFLKLIIPYVPLDQQRQIVRKIESRLSVCDKVEESITESLEKAKALRQSILKKAFEGTLLSEEEIAACKAAPDYEPASVLLKKIKAEKKK